MSFKETKDGWEYDPKGKARIPSKQALFSNIPPVVVYDAQTGYPLLPDGRIDWKRVEDDAKKGKQRG